MTKVSYNSWPLGKLPAEFRRPEPEQIRQSGYRWDDPRDIVALFEAKVARWAGSKYAVAVDCCSHAIFLCMRYTLVRKEFYHQCPIEIPVNTYVSVPQQIKHAGFDNVIYRKIQWSGTYRIGPTRVWDAAVRWTQGMHQPGMMTCLSFQIKKRVPIGRGGMILCDDEREYRWLKLASYDGRDLDAPYDSPGHVQMTGWHYYMTPEDAARGILLMDAVPPENSDQGGDWSYPPVSEIYLHH